MFAWLSNASKTLSTIIDESIAEEDARVNQPPKREMLTPLQGHIGLLKTKPKPLFHILPNELKLYIFSFLPPEDLISSVCIVSREWRKLANDDRSWKWRYLREQNKWNVFGFHPQFANYNILPESKTAIAKENGALVEKKNEQPEIEGPMSWKIWYLQQYFQNNKSFNSPQRALRKITENKATPFKFLSRGIKNPTGGLKVLMMQTASQNKNGKQCDSFRVPIFGQAMQSAAAGLLYRLMWSQESPLFVTRLYPGIDGIGSGIGFKVNSKPLNLAAIYGDCSVDIGDWTEFFESANGFIYVIDCEISDEQITKAQMELHSVLNTNESVPLIVFSCDNSLNTASEIDLQKNNAIEEVGEVKRLRTPCEIGNLLQLTELTQRRWCVHGAKTIGEICKGLEWLTSEL